MQYREKILNAIVTKLSHLSLGFLAERQIKAEKRRFLKSEGQVVVQLEFLSFREINREHIQLVDRSRHSKIIKKGREARP